MPGATGGSAYVRATMNVRRDVNTLAGLLSNPTRAQKNIKRVQDLVKSTNVKLGRVIAAKPPSEYLSSWENHRTEFQKAEYILGEHLAFPYEKPLAKWQDFGEVWAQLSARAHALAQFVDAVIGTFGSRELRVTSPRRTVTAHIDDDDQENRTAT